MTASADASDGSAPALAPRLPMHASAVLLCALGIAGIAQGGVLPSSFVTAFAVAAALRLVLGRDGRRFLAHRPLQILGCTVSALSLAYLFRALTRGDGREALWALMAVVSVFQTLVLLWRQRAFSSFLLILFSSVHATGIAFGRPGEGSGLFVGAYVVLLAWTLVVFERTASFERGVQTHGAVQRIRAPVARGLPWGAALRTAGLLVLLGVPAGWLIYLAAPRGLPELFGISLREGGSDAAAGSAGAADDRDADANSEDGSDWIVARTGPGRGAPLGSVAEIKRSLEPWFEVSLEDGEGRLPPTVILRDNVQDRYWQRGLWTETLSVGSRPQIYRDLDDGAGDGWFPLAHADDPQRGVTLRIVLQRGGQRRLYLQANPVRMRVERNGRPQWKHSVLQSQNETFTTSTKLGAGDVILQRYVPPVTNDARLVGRRSDSAVAPQTSYLQVPREVAGPLRARALQVIGTERDPWRRARALEAWLKSEAFTYTLKIPELDKRNPIVDFVERTRSANCEAFAFALTLMLRTLGHPARYVRGFWGGDVLEERRSVILRGSHYHAWTEMYLDGVGWIPLNPTPPDRRPADAGTITKAADGGESEGGFPPLRLPGLDWEGWRSFWAGVGRRIDAWVLAPLGWLFSAGAGFAGMPLLLLLLWTLRTRREARRLRRMAAGRGRRLPPGAYGKALVLLARKGLRRPVGWTVREFSGFVGRRLPQAEEPFEHLSRSFEDRRYGGGEGADAEDARRLGELRTALGRRSTS